MDRSLHVLVMGSRTGIVRALHRRAIPFAVWNERASEVRRVEHCHVQPFPSTREAVEKALGPLRDLPPFSHVIAGTEAAVVAAAHARRVLGARAAPFTVSLRCHDKLAMKQYLAERDIPMTPFLAGDEELDPERILASLGTPVVVKDRRSSGGRNMVFARSPAELARLSRRAILERHVDAPEVSVESFLRDAHVVFENVTEYREKAAVNVVPAGLPADLLERVLALNRRVLKALRITWGLTHLEVYLTADGPLFGEVALRPPGGYIMELLSLAYGMDAWDGFVALELDLPFDFPARPTGAAAAWVLHPGAGRVSAIEGVEAARCHPAVQLLKLKVKAGDLVAHRGGVGDDVGRVLLRAANRPALLAALDEVQRALRVRVRVAPAAP